jgi:hypothetical protein
VAERIRASVVCQGVHLTGAPVTDYCFTTNGGLEPAHASGRALTEGHYRALVAYLNFWTPTHPQFNLDRAIADIGITEDRQAVIDALAKAGWTFSKETGLLTYDQE